MITSAAFLSFRLRGVIHTFTHQQRFGRSRGQRRQRRYLKTLNNMDLPPLQTTWIPTGVGDMQSCNKERGQYQVSRQQMLASQIVLTAFPIYFRPSHRTVHSSDGRDVLLVASTPTLWGCTPRALAGLVNHSYRVHSGIALRECASPQPAS